MAYDLQQLIHQARLLPLRYLAIVLSLLFVSLIALSSDRTPSLASVANRWTMPGEEQFAGGAKKAPKASTGLHEAGLDVKVRANASFVILARNSDVWEIVSSIRGMEDRFNKDYNYPYTFLNDEPFSDEFKKYTSGVASGTCTYGTIDPKDWNDPDWIDQDKAKEAREGMEKAGVIYGGSVPYRRMCRWQSGYFFRNPLMNKYKYYWRVEPSVKYFCDIDYDPFMLMQQKKKKYGFVLTIYEYAETIPTLWDATKDFIKQNPQYLAKPNTMNWVSGDKGDTYNRCHFWSNFEIGDLDFFRSDAYLKYFEHLDKAGGFFYERWGDAPVHSIAASLFLKPDELHFFQDIGYRHEPFQHCPKDKADKCACNPQDENNFEEHWYSCTPDWKKITKWKPGMLHALGG